MATGRYDAVGDKAEFEPGSRGRVLRNRLGVTSVRAIERKESEALLIVTEQMIGETRIDQRFTAEDIRRMHRLWLREIYSWAGQYSARGNPHLNFGDPGSGVTEILPGWHPR